MPDERIIKLVAQLVIEKLKETENKKIPVGISNRHIHLSRVHLDKLFGEGYELTKMKDLKQPGQYAAVETVTLLGLKGDIQNVRILGPVRKDSQVEMSFTDSFKLGIKADIRESGKLDNTAGVRIIGPKGSVDIDKGAIVALRHIHASPQDAERMNVKDKDIVEVEMHGERCGTLGNVLVRVSPEFQLEMHVDLDEANAFSIKNGDCVILRK